MVDVHLISWTGALAESRLRTYRIVLRGVLIVDALLALFALVFPRWFAEFLGQAVPHPSSWPALWGAMTLGVCIFWASGLRRPSFYRWPNVAGIAVKLLLALVLLFAGRGFLLLALWEGATAVVLIILYYRMLIAEMGCRP
jgi:hypothetical protein